MASHGSSRGLKRRGIAPVLGVALVIGAPAIAGAALPDPGGTVDLGTDPGVEFVSPSAGGADESEVGYSVSDAGDVNKDGYADLIIGAPEEDWNTNPDAGAAYVVFGPKTAGQVDLANLGIDGFKIETTSTTVSLGTSVSGAGDVNGDGYDDVIVGAPHVDGSAADTGAAYVVFGSAGSEDVTIQSLGSKGFTIHGAQSSDTLGTSVSGAGDVNKDGFDDVVVGSPGWDGGTADAGGAFVILGSASPTDVFTASLGSADVEVSGGDPNGALGTSVSGAGDVNGDGYDDVVLGAPDETFTDGGPTGDRGAAYVLLGSATPTSTSSSSLTRIRGANALDDAGAAVSSAGDVNKDGYDDVLVGAPGVDFAGSNLGAAYLFLGSATPTTTEASTLATYEGATAHGGLGRSLSDLGDVNGDGYDDIVVGFTGNSSDLPKGNAYIVFGSAVPVGKAVDTLGSDAVTVTGAMAEDHLGFSVSGAGDVNGDGRPDVLLGAPFRGGAAGQSGDGHAHLILAQSPPKAPAPAPAPVTPTPDPGTAKIVGTIAALKRSVGAGGKITYRVVVRNTGDATATGVVARMTLPPGFGLGPKAQRAKISNRKYSLRKRTISWRLGDIPSGKTKAITLRLTTAQRAKGRKLARLRVTSDNAGSFSARRAVRVNQARLRASISAPNPVALARGLFRYRVTVRNTGKTAARRVVVSTRLPKGAVRGRFIRTKRFAVIPAGKTRSFTVTFRRDPEATGRVRARLTVRGGNAPNVARGRTTTLPQ